MQVFDSEKVSHAGGSLQVAGALAVLAVHWQPAPPHVAAVVRSLHCGGGVRAHLSSVHEQKLRRADAVQLA